MNIGTFRQYLKFRNFVSIGLSDLVLNIHASCCPQVLAGGHNIQLPSEPHRVEVTSYNSWAHPGWNPSTLDNDIALVELPAPLGSVHKVPNVVI